MSDSELGLQVPPGSTWVCSPIDVEWHEDWDAFHAYMDGYQEITHQASIKAAVTWNDAESTYLVRVTGFDDVHKHQVFKTIFEKHVSNRRVENPNLLAFVDELQAAGSKPKWIMQFFRKKTGKNATLRDVHNMVVRMKDKRRGGSTTEERLELVLRELCESRGNCATFFVDEKKTARKLGKCDGVSRLPPRFC
ncbi:hypothetical protein GQ600_26159 [Phytophthora cactorum]|nr:hypothetical protein GQ600_26159 [Phytophthora cactorum]